MTNDQFKTNRRIVKMTYPELNKIQVEARARDEQYMQELIDRIAFLTTALGDDYGTERMLGMRT